MYLLLYVCAPVTGGTHANMYTWRLADDFVNSALPFYLYTGSTDQNSMVRLVQQAPSPTEPSYQPYSISQYFSNFLSI